MAADRMSADLATLTDPWQPAVLALVAMAVRAGNAVDKPVGVCGEAAADPLLACVLTGLGVSSLSAASAAVNGVGAKLSQVTLQQCRDAADAVLATASAAEARAAALSVLGDFSRECIETAMTYASTRTFAPSAQSRNREKHQELIGPQSGSMRHACYHC